MAGSEVKNFPWRRLLDAAFGVADAAQGHDPRAAAGPVNDPLASPPPAAGYLEARLAGVVVAALREAFDRDSRRLELEREHLEAERVRAERALALERRRQAIEREIGRLRSIAAIAVASWLGTLLFVSRIPVGTAPGVRAMVAIGWILLLAALGLSFAEQARVARMHDPAATAAAGQSPQELTSGVAGTLAPWLAVGGIAMTAFGLTFF